MRQGHSTPTSSNLTLSKDQDFKPSEKTNFFSVNTLFSGMIVIVILGTCGLISKVYEWMEYLKSLNPDYDFPKLGDIFISLLLTPPMILIKVLLEKAFSPLCERILSKKFKDETDEQNFALGKVYVKKLATNCYKFLFYITTVTVGYSILKQLDYFPTELGGYGSLEKMYEGGFMGYYFHSKPDYFNLYYLGGLAYIFSDLIWLVFVYEMQSDFVLMLLHHLCTISLITFSYFTNHSNIGCIVLFLHDVGDIFVYFTRLIIRTDANSVIKILSGAALLVVYLYTRIYVFAKTFMSFYFYTTWSWSFVSACLWVFLLFLYVMHLHWVCMIIKSVTEAIFKNKIDDSSQKVKLNKQG